MRSILLVLAVLVAGCTDARWSAVTALGNQGHITCYSGGVITYEGDSTGKILSQDQSDGWLFKDAKTGKLVRVSGACVIVN